MELPMRAFLAAACGAMCSAAFAATPEIHTGDVHRFYALYDATGGRPSVEQLDAYLAGGSQRLQEFARAPGDGRAHRRADRVQPGDVRARAGMLAGAACGGAAAA